MPTHVVLHKDDASGLPMDSVIQCESCRTIDKKRIKGEDRLCKQRVFRIGYARC